MIRAPDFTLRLIRRSDLEVLAPLLSDLDLRGEYLPSALVSPVDLEQKFAADGIAGDGFTRLLIVENGSDRIIGTIWHFRSVPYFKAREGRGWRAARTSCAGARWT